uniref:Uncharacterized protein n=1 Tax=Angiostrongylus cantonensis TaxID=6313 RepID=A0A0K0DHN0_ANGCA
MASAIRALSSGTHNVTTDDDTNGMRKGNDRNAREIRKKLEADDDDSHDDDDDVDHNSDDDDYDDDDHDDDDDDEATTMMIIRPSDKRPSLRGS